MTDAAAVAVTPPRGPSLDYSVAAVVPDLAPTDLIGRGRYYPRDVTRRYPALPFPRRAVGRRPVLRESLARRGSRLP